MKSTGINFKPLGIWGLGQYVESFRQDNPTINNVFSPCKGRMFDRWIDTANGATRSNGYNEGDLIENPEYMIESLLRDEVFTERNLTIDSVTASSTSAGVNAAEYVGTSGQDDCTAGGAETTSQTHTYEVKITKLAAPADKYQWRVDSGSWSSDTAITGSSQSLTNGITVTFGATTGHDIGDIWSILSIPATTGNTIVVCSALKSSINEYYTGAIFHNVTTGTKSYVSQYDGSTNSLYLSVSDGSASDDFYLTNVQGDIRINEASFDKVGNTTDGLRDGWKMRIPITKVKNVKSIINQMLYESHCIGFDTYEGFKVVALDATVDSVDTWTTPLNRNSERELVSADLTPLANISTDFRLRYGYDYGKGDYTKEYFVNPSGYTSGASLSTEEGLCQDAISNYKIPNRKFEYSSDLIYDDATALLLLKKLVAWKTSQKLVVEWSGDISSYMQYEKGDQVILNYSDMIPTGLNNSNLFIITGKNVQPKKKVDLSLLSF